MNEQIRVHNSPENSVFGVIGKDVSTDEDKLYIKIRNDTRNTGWVEIPPTPTPTPTITITPSKTPIVTKQVSPSPTPTHTPTSTITPTVTRTPLTITPTPTPTKFKSYIQYSIVSTTGGTATRVDGPSSGLIAVGTGTMQLQAIPDEGYSFVGWDAPEAVILSDPNILNPIASGFDTFNDVTITAQFSQIYSQTYSVTVNTSARGAYSFTYIDAVGNTQSAYGDGLPPNSTIFNVLCAVSIVGTVEGDAFITTNAC